jgi:hypothetical protein
MRKIPRMAPMEFIGRYLDGFFDYGIADEVHELRAKRARQCLGNDGPRVTDGDSYIFAGRLRDDVFNIPLSGEPKRMREGDSINGEAGGEVPSVYGV